MAWSAFNRDRIGNFPSEFRTFNSLCFTQTTAHTQWTYTIQPKSKKARLI